MANIPNDTVDMIFCDLPYGTTDCKWDEIIPFVDLWKQYNRVIKDNGAIVLFSAQPFTTKLINSNFKDYRYSWYWKKNNKTGNLLAKFQPMRCVEDICVFYQNKPTYNPQGLKKLEKPLLKKQGKNTDIYGKRKNNYYQHYTNYPSHFLEFKNNEKQFHPSQKPVELLEYLIRTYTNENETVLDNCMGSGSTGVASLNTGRKFIGIEKDEQYFKIAKKRIKEKQDDLYQDKKLHNQHIRNSDRGSFFIVENQRKAVKNGKNEA